MNPKFNFFICYISAQSSAPALTPDLALSQMAGKAHYRHTFPSSLYKNRQVKYSMCHTTESGTEYMINGITAWCWPPKIQWQLCLSKVKTVFYVQSSTNWNKQMLWGFLIASCWDSSTMQKLLGRLLRSKDNSIVMLTYLHLQ